MAATGFGTAIIPGLMGVLARQISLEIIPVSLLVVYFGLFACYVLAMMFPKTKMAAAPASSGHVV